MQRLAQRPLPRHIRDSLITGAQTTHAHQRCTLTRPVLHEYGTALQIREHSHGRQVRSIDPLNDKSRCRGGSKTVDSTVKHRARWNAPAFAETSLTSSLASILRSQNTECSSLSDHRTPGITDRLQSFVESLPIRNYVQDFDIWSMSPDEVWARYQQLSSPRCLAISRQALRHILSALAQERPRSKSGMQRFLSIIEEMLEQQPPIVPELTEWTTCISFVGRQHRHPSAYELEQCLALWRKMEDFGVSASRTTLNVLLNISVRAKSWKTVEIIRDEMRDRGYLGDRYTWTALIASAGEQKNGEELRRVCRQMLESGEIVDIYILNNIMTAYIKAEEADHAELLFKQITSLAHEIRSQSETKDFPPPPTTEQSRELTAGYVERANLNRAALLRGLKLEESDLAPRASVSTPFFLVPDAASFNIMLQHHCTHTGNYVKVQGLLEDMETFKIPDSYSMYKSLMMGFAKFGSPCSLWHIARLHLIITSLLANKVIPMKQELVKYTIKALRKTGSKENKIRQVWTLLDARWQANGGDVSRRSSNIMSELSSND